MVLVPTAADSNQGEHCREDDGEMDFWLSHDQLRSFSPDRPAAIFHWPRFDLSAEISLARFEPG